MSCRRVATGRRCTSCASTDAALARYDPRSRCRRRSRTNRGDWVMQRNILRSALYGALLIGLTAAVGGCGGGGSGSPPTPTSGTLPLTIRGAALYRRAPIRVDQLCITPVPPGRGGDG